MENSLRKDVFISYKAEEYAEALWVKTTLETNGISCWLAPGSIPGGSNYALEIPMAIRNCKAFVLLLSEKAQCSKWVPRELDQAINENKIIMPFMLENCALKDDFNFYLTNVQRYAAYENKAAAMEKMIREIKAVVAASEPIPAASAESVVHEPENTPSAPVTTPSVARESAPPRAKKGKKRLLFISVLLFLLVACVVAVFCFADFSQEHAPSDKGEEGASSEYGFKIDGTTYLYRDTYLSLSNTTLTAEDVENISKMEDLAILSLENCSIEAQDIGGLLGASVYSLHLSDCNLSASQISSLNFTGMKIYTLNLCGNPNITSLDFIAPLASDLTNLKISGTSVTDLSVLSSFSELTSFEANGNGISDLTPLSGCSKLESVRVNDNRLTSLTGLESAIALKHLSAGGNQIQSLDALANATRLTYVYLNDNEISDISLLQKSSKTLESVYLRNNSVSDLMPLSGCASLKYINVDNNSVSSLAALDQCNSLYMISAAGNEINSTLGLEGNRSFRYLNLANNCLTSAWTNQPLLFDFTNDETVVVIDLSGNSITDLNLSVPAYYKILNLAGNPLSDFSSVYALKGSYLLLDYASFVDYSKLKVFSELYLLDCPFDQRMDITDIWGSYNVHFEDSASFTLDTAERSGMYSVKGDIYDMDYYK